MNKEFFNNIDLQLHASSNVSNPYTFSITSDIAFASSEISAEVPSSDTYLYHNWYTSEDDNGEVGSCNPLVIPSGVNVIKVSCGGNGSQNDDPCWAYVTNIDNNNYWINESHEGAAGGTTYVGVTPGKTYHLDAGVGSELEIVDYSIVIMYSQSINQKTPKITDY